MPKYLIFSNKQYRNYLYLATIIYFIAAICNIGHNTGDSYSQIFEFAGYKLGFINQDLLRAWEFHSAIRSSLEIWLLYYVYKLYSIFTEPNPFMVALCIRLLCAGLSLFSTVLFSEIIIHKIKSPVYQKLFIILSLFTSLIIYTSIHYNSENIAGRLLLIALAVLLNDNWQTAKKYLITGVLLGVIFTVRFQMGLAISGIIVWLIVVHRIPLRHFIVLFLSILLSIFIFNVLVDYWFYGHWTISAYNYFYQNLVLNKVDSFGTSPWYAYMLMPLAYLPFGPIYVIACLVYIYKNPKDLISWTIVPFILVHCLIGHKEVRFLMPILYLQPFFTIYLLERLIPDYQNLGRKTTLTIKLIWWLNLIGYIFLIFPASTELPAWSYIYKHYHKPTLYFYSHGVEKRDIFYTRHNLQTIHVTDINQIHCDPNKNCLYGVSGVADNYKIPYKLVYRLLPNSINNYPLVRGIGHIDIYELNNIESLTSKLKP